MNKDEIKERTLSRNSIRNFILRIDLIKNDKLNLKKIAEAASQYFDRTEKRQINNFTINFTNSDSNLTKQEVFDFVLITESKSVSLTFSEFQNAFWIESSHYKNNSVYKDILRNVIEIIKRCCSDIEAKRIGLRYINEFKCEKIKDMNCIYGKRLYSILKFMTSENNQSRIIGMEEYNNDGYKMRLQYGIPNKFYPAAITVCDLVLDIDSYKEYTCKVEEWEDIIAKLNHAAYDKFIKEINAKYLEEIK